MCSVQVKTKQKYTNIQEEITILCVPLNMFPQIIFGFNVLHQNDTLHHQLGPSYNV